MENKSNNSKFHIDHKYFFSPLELNGLKLLQIGERLCTPETGFPEHDQLCFEITYVYSGVAINSINGEKYAMRPNTINFTFVGQKHSIYADDVNLRYYYLGFDLSEKHPLFDYFQNMVKEGKAVYVYDPFNTNLTFLNAIAHVEKQDNLSKFIVSTAVNQILCDFLRAYNGEKSITELNFKNNDVLLYNMLCWLDENYLSYKNLEELSAKLSYSESYLSHLFKNGMHCSISDYVLDKKLSFAADLLKTKEKSVTEIAEITGYASLHSFSKAFKKKYGISPSDYSR